jgi:hypothetical protein
MADGGSPQDILQRIKPILDKVAVDGLRAWLRSIDFTVPPLSRVAMTDFIAQKIAKEQLTESALEAALIGFEEASDMRIYLLRLDDNEAKTARKSLPGRLPQFGIPLTNQRTFAGARTSPMSPVYGQIQGDLLRVKWAEEHRRLRVNPDGSGLDSTPITKRAVLIADFSAGTAELRLNPAENGHSYHDSSGRPTPDAYYRAYLQKCSDVLGCKCKPIELRPVIKNLVEQEEPRIIRIHIDNHTNQKNYSTTTRGPRADVRDNPDWRLAYNKNGSTWAWDAQSFYWLPKLSSGFLTREVFSHIDAEDGFVKVNADITNDEVDYVVSQIRAR